MAVKHEIEFTINPDGSIGLEVKGVSGASCTEITREIEEALGIVSNRQYTSEYYQTEETVHTTVSVSADEKK